MSHHQHIKQTEGLLRHHEQQSNRCYEKLKRLRKGTLLTVSDHATVRYMERVKKIDIIAAHAELITPQTLELYRKLGDGEYPTGTGSTRVVIKDGVIVTVLM